MKRTKGLLATILIAGSGPRWFMKLPKLLVTLLIVTTAFLTAAQGADPKAKAKSKLKPLPPGPAWVDTNHDGQLSNDELKRARQILEGKIKMAKSGKSTQAETKSSKSTKQ